MAYTTQPRSGFQQRKDYLMNGGDAPKTGGPLTYQAPEPQTGGPLNYQPSKPASNPLVQPTNTSAQVSAPAPQVASSQNTLAPPKPVQQQPSFQQTGTLQERLFNPLQTGAEQGSTSLGEAAAFFQQEAGPSRTYEGIGAQDTLDRAITGGSAADLEAARGLAGAQYGGPQGLDQQSVAGLQNLLNQMRTRQQALGTGGGLQTLIQQSVAGLTPGQARFEAERRLGGAKEQARDTGFETTAPLAAQLAAERERAQSFAEQRTGEEADIAARSKSFLTGERGKIETGIQSQMEAARAQQEQERGEWQDLVQAAGQGDREAFEELKKANPELASQLDTEARRMDIQADEEFQGIMADPKYAKIANIDPLGLTITKRGKQFYAADGTDLRKAIPDKATRALLYERQQALEKKFDVGTARPFSKTGGPGEFSEYRSLYGGEGFVPPEIVNYLGFDPGMKPSRANMSTAEQKEHFNRIQDVLGNLDQIGESEPFRAAQIFADVDQYLEDEASTLESNKEDLTKAQQSWYTDVKKARKEARKAKREKKYAQIGAVIGGVVGTVAGGPLGGVVGAGAGQQIGTSLA